MGAHSDIGIRPFKVRCGDTKQVMNKNIEYRGEDCAPDNVTCVSVPQFFYGKMMWGRTHCSLIECDVRCASIMNHKTNEIFYVALKLFSLGGKYIPSQ